MYCVPNTSAKSFTERGSTAKDVDIYTAKVHQGVCKGVKIIATALPNAAFSSYEVYSEIDKGKNHLSYGSS